MKADDFNDPGEPSPIGELLDRVLGGLGAPPATALAGVFGAWEDIVGEVVATHARPVRIDAGRLVVAVDDPVWATELRYRAAELVDRVCETLRSNEITRIEVVARRHG